MHKCCSWRVLQTVCRWYGWHVPNHSLVSSCRLKDMEFAVFKKLLSVDSTSAVIAATPVDDLPTDGAGPSINATAPASNLSTDGAGPSAAAVAPASNLPADGAGRQLMLQTFLCLKCYLSIDALDSLVAAAHSTTPQGPASVRIFRNMLLDSTQQMLHSLGPLLVRLFLSMLPDSRQQMLHSLGPALVRIFRSMLPDSTQQMLHSLLYKVAQPARQGL